jgi:DNA (cytosine-5)-methyltransferase 1
MYWKTRIGDGTPPEVQAIEEVAVDKVLRKRKCHFTPLNDKTLRLSDVNLIPRGISSDAEKFRWIFNHGTLICRYVYTAVLYNCKGCSYRGEARFMYQRECVDIKQWKIPIGSTGAQQDEQPSVPMKTPSPSKKYRSSDSPQEVNASGFLKKTLQKLFNDIFTCGGGTSAGAEEAGLIVNLGLERDEIHMSAYIKNFSGAQHLRMDAHDFPSIARRCKHGAHHCHISAPCCYWAMCQ